MPRHDQRPGNHAPSSILHDRRQPPSTTTANMKIRAIHLPSLARRFLPSTRLSPLTFLASNGVPSRTWEQMPDVSLVCDTIEDWSGSSWVSVGPWRNATWRAGASSTPSTRVSAARRLGGPAQRRAGVDARCALKKRACTGHATVRHTDNVAFATRGKLTFMVRGRPFQHGAAAPGAPDEAAAGLELLAVDGLRTVHVHVPLREELAGRTRERARGILRGRRRSLKRERRAGRRRAVTQLEHDGLSVDCGLAAG